MSSPPPAKLASLTIKELTEIAKSQGLSDIRGKKKEELVRLVANKRRADAVRERRRLAKIQAQSLPDTGTEQHDVMPKKEAQPIVKSQPLPAAVIPKKIAPVSNNKEDQLILMVRDSYWLHLFWKLSQKGTDRAKAALGHFWHTAFPVLRVFKLVSDGMSNPRKDFYRDIRIHTDVSHWYVDVDNPPSTFQVEFGYLTREQRFFSIISSNIVETPQRQVCDAPDNNWSDVANDFERIYKLSGGFEDHNPDIRQAFEEHLKRPMSAQLLSRAGTKSLTGIKTRRNFSLVLNADVVIRGKTDPSVQVSVKDEPIPLSPDGSFSVRYLLSEKRQVFRIEASSNDGVEKQTVILSIDRNTKVMETIFSDGDSEE